MRGFLARLPRYVLQESFIAAALCLIALTSAAADLTQEKDSARPEPPLPLKRVVLFSSSVGFFEHGGELEGNQQIDFSFKSSDINDLLKSLVVQDLGGGLVTAVNYGSPEPITHALRTFAIDLTETPSLAQIFQQLRGQQVQLEAPAPLTGAIVGIETRRIPSGDKEPLTADFLNLRTEQGLESVRVESIVRTRFLHPKIDREFQQALDVLAQARTNDQKRVKLDFRGAGKRTVSVGYIQEAPVWKTSYRLVLADGQPPFLQGWAIVENTTAQDWRDVQLTLISGRPISFLMDLYQPLYMSRPFVTPEQHASLRPRVYEQDLAARAQEFEGAAAKSVSNRPRRGGVGGMGGGMMGGGMGGGGFFPGGGDGKKGQEPLVTSVIPDGTGKLDLTQGVTSAAIADDVGELFRYGIKAPVTLGRIESAMLPIVNDAVQGEKLSIYNPAVHAKHPLAGLRLTNTTPLHLLQGPITLFDSGEYAGDARIEDIPPGSTRLVSYALDLETEVVLEERPPEQVIVSLQISKGGLHVKHKVTRQIRYLVKNSSAHAKQVLIERPLQAPWNLISPPPVEKTRSVARFSLTAEPGKPATLVAVEERDLTEEVVLATLTPAQSELYLHARAASPAFQKALRDALDRKTAAADIQANRLATEGLIAGIWQDQDRLRKNLQAIPTVPANDPAAEQNRQATRELTQRYLSKLTDLENELEKLHGRVIELKKNEARANQELETVLQSLVVE